MFRPHWVCPVLGCLCFPRLHCSGSRLLYMERALCCVWFQFSGTPQKAWIRLRLRFVSSPAWAVQAARGLGAERLTLNSSELWEGGWAQEVSIGTDLWFFIKFRRRQQVCSGSLLIAKVVNKKKAQCESCEFSFTWDKMRTIAQGSASQISLRNCSEKWAGEVSIYVILVILVCSQANILAEGFHSSQKDCCHSWEHVH